MSAAHLKRALILLSAAETEALAIEAGVDRPRAFQARRGVTVPASDFMRLCGAIGLDPLSGDRIAPRATGDVAWWALGAAITMARAANKHPGIRDAARAARTHIRALSDVDNLKPVCVTTFLKLCRYVEISPFVFAPPPPVDPPACFTRNGGVTP